MNVRGKRSCGALAALFATLLLSVISKNALASEPIVEKPALKMDMNLALPDTILLNVPFEISLEVTVQDTVQHYESPIDKISLGLPQYCEVIEGNTVWRGVLSKGSHITIHVVAKFSHPQNDFFQAVAMTRSVPSHPEIYTTENWIRSRYYSITGPLDTQKIDSRGNKFKLSETHEPHYPLGNLKADSAKSNIQFNDRLKPNRIRLRVTQSSPNDLGVQQYYRTRDNIITFETFDSTSGLTRKLLPKAWSFDCTKCGLEIRPDSSVKITVDELKDSATLQVELAGSPHKLFLKVRSITMVSGYFRYVTNFADTVPGYGTWAELYGMEDGQWILCDSLTVPQNGRYQLQTDLDYVKLEFWSLNHHCLVPYSAGCWTAGPLPWYFYVLNLEFGITEPGGVFEISPWITTEENLNWAGAFNICKWLQVGGDYAEQCCGEPPQVIVKWGYNCNTLGTVHQADTIWVQSQAASGQNRDQWDESIILHEYGHHFMDAFSEEGDNSSGNHYFYEPYPLQNYVYERVAYDEGFATWFQGVVRNDGRHVDLKNLNDTNYAYSFEEPDPDVPYTNSVDVHQLSPSSPMPIYQGPQVEGAIIDALWDIYDSANDGNYYKSGQLWGHNNDQNQNDGWRGADAVLDVLENYDPFPSDAHHNHPWDIYEFSRGWQALGYPISGHYKLRRSGSERCSETTPKYTTARGTSREPNLNLYGVRNPTSHIVSKSKMSGFSSRVTICPLESCN